VPLYLVNQEILKNKLNMQGVLLTTSINISRFVVLGHLNLINVLPTNEVKTTIQNLGVVNKLRSSFFVPAKQSTNHQKRTIIPARDAKQCAGRILKGKAERTYKYQWLQASRTRATLVVKRRDTR